MKIETNREELLAVVNVFDPTFAKIIDSQNLTEEQIFQIIKDKVQELNDLNNTNVQKDRAFVFSETLREAADKGISREQYIELAKELFVKLID